MEINIVVPDESVSSFTVAAKNELKLNLTEIGKGIVDESNLIERTERDDGSAHEVIESDVKSASHLFKRRMYRNKISKRNKVLNAVSAISSFGSGVLFGFTSNKFLLVLAVVLCIVFVVTYLFANFFSTEL